MPLAKGPSCLVICIDSLVAGDVGEFASFAKFTLFAKFTIFVKLAILDTREGGLLVLLFALLVAGEVGKIVKIASKAMQSLVGNFDNFANFVVTGISGHKWIRVKRLAKRTLERRASFLTLRTVPF